MTSDSGLEFQLQKIALAQNPFNPSGWVGPGPRYFRSIKRANPNPGFVVRSEFADFETGVLRPTISPSQATLSWIPATHYQEIPLHLAAH